jgi:hypothetical protein
MPPINTSSSPARGGGSEADIKSQGAYETIAGFRRSQTLTKAQLDPAQYSKTRRKNYRTGKASTA